MRSIKEIREELDLENKKGYGHGPYWNPGKVTKLKEELKEAEDRND